MALPPGEAPSDWVAAFALTELEPGVPGNGAFVVVNAQAQSWVVVVRDHLGHTQQVALDPPETAQEREDFAWLVASLLVPVEVPAAPIAVVAQALPPAPRVSPPRPAPPPPPEPEPEPAPVVVEPPTPPPEVANLPDKRPSRAWASAAAAARFGTAAALSPAVELGVGYHLRESFDIGFFVEPDLPSQLDGQPDGRQVRHVDLRGGLGASLPHLPVASVALTGGASQRTFTDQGEVAETAWIPFAGLECAGRIPLGRSAALVPHLRAELDLRSTEIRSDGLLLSTLSPLGFHFGLRVAAGSKSR